MLWRGARHRNADPTGLKLGRLARGDHVHRQIAELQRRFLRIVAVGLGAGWIDATPPDGHAVLNTGMMLEHLSKGVLPTGIHRVVARPGQTGSRFSVVQFCHPTPSTILQPMVSCVTPGNPERFAAISAADRLDEVLWQINLTT